MVILQKQPPEVFFKKAAPKNFWSQAWNFIKKFLEHVFAEHLWATGPCLFNAIMINFESIKLARSFIKMI